MGVSLTGAFLCTRAQIRQMLRQDGGGAIVNVSSGAGVKGFKGQAAYAATKHFSRAADLWDRPGREAEKPYFGWRSPT